MTRNWLCLGSRCLRVPRFVAATGDSGLRTMHGVTARVALGTWVRYEIDLASARSPVPEGSLTPVTESIIAELRNHPDREQNQLKSGFGFWDHGLRRAFVWLGDEGPLCIQWLLTESDNDLLRRLPHWSGMYPPIPSRWGQVENLFAFSTARRKGVASQFEFLLYEQAKQLGLQTLITHIHADNVAARGWAERTGWSAYGEIRRYTFDAPGLRDGAAYVHRTSFSPVHREPQS